MFVCGSMCDPWSHSHPQAPCMSFHGLCTSLVHLYPQVHFFSLDSMCIPWCCAEFLALFPWIYVCPIISHLSHRYIYVTLLPAFHVCPLASWVFAPYLPWFHVCFLASQLHIFWLFFMAHWLSHGSVHTSPNVSNNTFPPSGFWVAGVNIYSHYIFWSLFFSLP